MGCVVDYVMSVRYYSVRDGRGAQVRQVYNKQDAEDYKAEGMTVIEMVNHYKGRTVELGEI